MGEQALRLETGYGVPVSPVAFITHPETMIPAALQALAGTGIRYAVRPAGPGESLEWWEAPDQSRILVAQVPPGGDPESLRFGTDSAAMGRQIEQWLAETPSLLPQTARPSTIPRALTVVAAASFDEDLHLGAAAVRRWNASYAYPKILAGAVGEFEAHLDTRSPERVPVVRVPAVTSSDPPTALELRLAGDRHAASASARAAVVLEPLAELLGHPPGTAAATAVANAIETDFPGHLVINTTPFRRTDVSTLTAERPQLVTDIPPLGYAFIVERALEPLPVRTEHAVSSPFIETAGLRVALDRVTGAIASLATLPREREWSGTQGLNTVRGSILQRVTREDIPGFGKRLIADRWSSDLGDFRSVMSVYDSLPWIDIQNEVRRDRGATTEYRFALDLPSPTVRWETPAGFGEWRAPVRHVAHLRWLAVESEGASVLFRGMHAPWTTVRSNGTIVSPAPAGRSRYRLAVADRPVDIAECARFGWSTEPLLPVPIAGRGSGLLPRFGSLVTLDQPDAVILGLKRADDGNGMIAYIQDLSGVDRYLTLGHGLLAFEEARRTDLLERDTTEKATAVPNGVAFPIPAHAVVAFRLVGIVLRRA
jgi:hypothetical protein